MSENAPSIDRRIADLPVAVDRTEDAVILEVDLAGTVEQIWAPPGPRSCPSGP
jgi:hypothetical protein